MITTSLVVKCVALVLGEMDVVSTLGRKQQNGVIRRNVIGTKKGRKKTYNDLQNTTWSGVIICHKLKDRQNNCPRKKYKNTNNDLQY
jgi:hypothetical protein